MKKVLYAAIACLLCAVLLCPLLTVSLQAKAGAGTLKDEKSRETRELTLSDGTKTGVDFTQITLSGFYGDSLANVAEFDLSNTHLSVEVINSGDYMVSSQLVTKAVTAYNNTHAGQTVLATMNGDLWMTKVHSNGNVTTAVLKVPRGVLIIDHEIWATEQIDQENLMATNAEKGTSAGAKSAFGVTDANQPLVGSPDIRLTLVNKTRNGTVTPDGLNRLPATNALIVYNQRVNNSNYALNDAYEVEIEVTDSSAVTLTGKVSGKVKAIYPAGSETRPAIGEKSLILTARGNKINTLSAYQIGDEVELTAKLTDRYGNTELWQTVEDAIGGHITVLKDGKPFASLGGSDYPCALIGYRADGKVMFTTVTAQVDKKYAGLNFAKALQFCRELGYNDVFYLDGGGSTTMAVLDGKDYTVRSKSSDGTPRAVINAVAVVWNEQKVCEKQGSLSYIDVPVDTSDILPLHMDGAFLADYTTGANAVNLSYDAEERAMKMTTSTKTNDPYAMISLTEFKRVNAADYPYLVFKLKTDNPKATDMVIFYAVGKIAGANPGYIKSMRVQPGDDWQYVIYDMSKAKGWEGQINNFRLDIFDSVNTDAGISMWFGGMTLCQTKEEAEQVKDGFIPEGAIGDYLAYKESLKPEEPTTPEETTKETPEETSGETLETTQEETTAGQETGTTAEVVTATDSDESGEMSTERAEQSTDGGKSSGCGSMVALIALPVLAVGGVALRCRRKEE